jgi:hypothetical protein
MFAVRGQRLPVRRTPEMVSTSGAVIAVEALTTEFGSSSRRVSCGGLRTFRDVRQDPKALESRKHLFSGSRTMKRQSRHILPAIGS